MMPISGDPTRQEIVATIAAVLYERRLLKAGTRLRLLYTFAQVIFEEGLSVAEYASRMGVSRTSMSRNLLELGVRDHDFRPGLNLIVSKWHPRDRRQHQSFLTDEGRKINRAVAGELVKRAASRLACSGNQASPSPRIGSKAN